MKNLNTSDCFYGAATIGERGQIVIPAEARTELGFQPGDKVLIMRHPVHEGIVVFKIEAIREFLNDFSASLDRAEREHTEGESR